MLSHLGIGFGLALTPTVMVMESIFQFYPDVRDMAIGISLSGTGKNHFCFEVLCPRKYVTNIWYFGRVTDFILTSVTKVLKADFHSYCIVEQCSVEILCKRIVEKHVGKGY